MKIAPLLAALSLAVALAPPPASAHEAAAKRGGIVRSASDLQFELVMRGPDAVLYVDDHGKPLSTAGMSGKLTILQGKDTTEVALQPAGENRMEAKGARLQGGARLVATVNRGAAKAVTVRFALK